MYTFNRYKESSLYISSETGENMNFFGFYLPFIDDLPQSIDYNESWTEYAGVYIFIKTPPDDAGMTKLLDYLQVTFPFGNISYASVAWINPSADSSPYTYFLMDITKTLEDEIILNKHFSLEILGSFFLLSQDSAVLPKYNEDGSLWGLIVEYPIIPENPEPMPEKNVHIPFTGTLRGCIQSEIGMYESEQSDSSYPKKGFYTFITKPDNPDNFLGCYYPMYSNTGQSEVYTGYRMCYDPLDPFNKTRTRYTYAGYAYKLISIDEPPYRQIQAVAGKGLAKKCNYSSVFGNQINIIPLADTDNPASYVQCQLPPGYDYSYYLAPEGDFQIVSDAVNPNMGAGLSGTEFFKTNVVSSDQKLVLRFESYKPACIKAFPFVLASPVGPPSDSLASPFSDNFLTSWATIFIDSDNTTPVPYVSQPAGASLYTKSDKKADSGILAPADLAFLYTSDKSTFFPMFPYAGLKENTNTWAMSKEDITALEAVVMSPQRRKIISGLSTTNAHLIRSGALTGETKQATTPSGILATTTQHTDSGSIVWDKFLLGQNMVKKNGQTTTIEMAFNTPSDEVVTAMQSSDVFLVASNATHLTGFANTMEIAGWNLTANVGKDQSYGDYSNIMIFKGRKGKLYDPDDVSKCLIANPKKWNQAQDFSIPITNGSPDESQLVILSNWLQQYFKNAHNQTSDYFEKFNTIASDENWTGILFLRVDITGMPDNLSGIVAGVSNPSAFNAHHLGIEVSPVSLDSSGVPQLDKPSSFFGLIYYVDPGFSDVQPVQPIPPATSDTYDFKLLALKVLFENTAVKGFESYAQLTINSLFGSQVTKMNNPNNIYNNVLFTGCLQINQGTPIYSLESHNDDAFYLYSNIINKVEITGALLSSRAASDSTNQRSWFGLTGFIDYKILTYEDKDNNILTFDLFSFGNNENEDYLRKGLNFSNLGVALDFPKDNPAQNTLSFVADEMRFNPSPNVSTPRTGSIYSQLHLGLENIVVGASDKSPKDLGYLDMIPDMALGGLGKESWYGLRFKLNMGTPGALAGNIGLNSYILISWSPQSTGEGYKANISISLPGSSGGGKLLSLQTVLTLSIGQIRLTRVDAQQNKVFMIMFTEIALKFLGLLKLPPSGNTLFYLFGDPTTTDSTGALGWYAMYKQNNGENDQNMGLKQIVTLK